MDNSNVNPKTNKPELSFSDKMKIKAIRNVGIPILQDVLPALTPLIIDFIQNKKLNPNEAEAILYMFIKNNNVYVSIGYIDSNNTIVRYTDIMPFSDFVIKMISEINKL